MLNTRFAEHDGPPTDLARALDDFEMLPDNFPGLPKLAATLVITQMRKGTLRETPAIERAVRFAAVADRNPAPMADWPPAAAALRAMDLCAAAQKGRPGFDPRAALQEVIRLAAQVGDAQPYAT